MSLGDTFGRWITALDQGLDRLTERVDRFDERLTALESARPAVDLDKAVLADEVIGPNAQRHLMEAVGTRAVGQGPFLLDVRTYDRRVRVVVYEA